MLNPDLHLNQDIFNNEVECKSNREALGQAVLELGRKNPEVVVLTADLTESVKADYFLKEFPDRHFQTGIAEQNMMGIAAGLALSGKMPFAITHSVFSPARNWDQIRVSVCLSNANVKIVGTHLGFSNGTDGPVAESLEDVALMRVLPNMTVLQPMDAIEVKKAVFAAAEINGPVYLRISKEKTPIISTGETPFTVGQANVLKEGKDLTIISSGPITYEALMTARELKNKHKIEAQVVSCSTVKPLDKELVKLIGDNKKVVTVEEHQIIGGLGSAVAELLSETSPKHLLRIGMNDCFGQSGTPQELKDKYKISSHNIMERILNFIQ